MDGIGGCPVSVLQRRSLSSVLISRVVPSQKDETTMDVWAERPLSGYGPSFRQQSVTLHGEVPVLSH